ncbi:uncharacterized protein M6B38_232745 [Iris pallida]|uniref:Uncharacterized protein n=1 Tax=Iris pallida TaxID=29817 RepID=A0AAX6DRU1_IRIPA|nr:uncharacterized protein M6B38_232745 [Iris pallida]
MEEDHLFGGLPPPSSKPQTEEKPPPMAAKKDPSPAPPPPPPLAPPLKSALKSSLKRSNPPPPPPPPSSSSPSDAAAADGGTEAVPQKRLRFKTSVDATTTQVIEAMQKIASHIKNPSKFSKASKLALQLIQAGSVKPGTSDDFFAILEAAMASPSACSDTPVRADYQALFSAVQDVKDCFNKQQKNQLTTWTIRAVLANDLYTDDSFVFSKAAGKIKEAISSLPSATADDDKDEAAALAKSENEAVDTGNQADDATPSDPPRSNQEVSDPFGLDALIPSKLKKDERSREKEVVALKRKAEEEELKRFIKSQREALLLCLETAARRYKTPWAQTVIDILAKHAFDHIDRFTTQQREAIGKLWASINEQHIRRKQGKSVTGKLDMNGFEWLQEKYANEKISIRRAVGGGGDRRAQQWLG